MDAELEKMFNEWRQQKQAKPTTDKAQGIMEHVRAFALENRHFVNVSEWDGGYIVSIRPQAEIAYIGACVSVRIGPRGGMSADFSRIGRGKVSQEAKGRRAVWASPRESVKVGS